MTTEPKLPPTAIAARAGERSRTMLTAEPCGSFIVGDVVEIRDPSLAILRGRAVIVSAGPVLELDQATDWQAGDVVIMAPKPLQAPERQGEFSWLVRS